MAVVAPSVFSALTPEPWLRIETGRPVPDGRWVLIRYRAGLTGDPVRPLLRLRYADGRVETEIMAGPVCGAARWVMRIPPGIVWLEISPVVDAGPFAFALDAISILSRPALLLGALRRKPVLALKALVLRLRGKRVRARHFIKSIWASDPFSRYTEWAAEREAPALPDAAPASEPEVTILVDGRGASPGEVARTLASLDGQQPRPAFLVLGPPVGDASGAPPHDQRGLPELLAQVHPKPGWVGVVGAGDLLAPGALAAFAAHAGRHPGLTAIYSDEDLIDADGRRYAPRLKPDWSPRLQAGTGYVGGLLLVRSDVIAKGPAEQGTDLAGALLASALAVPNAAVGHVRRILYHRAVAQAADRAAAAESVRPVWPDEALDETLGATPAAPSVSIVVPNRDRLGLLKPCIEGLRHNTDYPSFTIVIVDNGSVEAATLAYYALLADDPRITILEQPGPFNFSGLCNAAVAASTGEIVVLLNNDVEVIAPDWLGILVAEASRPEAGAVGARLLYPDGRLQHGGVVIGLGGAAGHIHRGRAGDGPGWLGRLAVPHEVSAVTGACLAVSRAKYEAVGGLDEELFPVSFNDIDFCLKLQAQGWCNMMAPDAVLYHRESASRGRDHAGAKQARAEREAANFAAKWHAQMRDDPYFHPGLSLLRFDVSLG